MSRRDEDSWERRAGCIRSIPSLIQVILLVISFIRACTLLAPSDHRYLVCVDVHSSDSNLVTWYCQNDGRLYNCTSDKDETLALNLPPIIGVASDSSGVLRILFKVRNVYWLGDLTGPQSQVLNYEPNVDIVDIALNEDENLIGLCIIRGKAHDCFGDPRYEYKLKEDQHFVGVSWDDDDNAAPKAWCVKQNEIDICEKVE